MTQPKAPKNGLGEKKAKPGRDRFFARSYDGGESLIAEYERRKAQVWSDLNKGKITKEDEGDKQVFEVPVKIFSWWCASKAKQDFSSTRTGLIKAWNRALIDAQGGLVNTPQCI